MSGRRNDLGRAAAAGLLAAALVVPAPAAAQEAAGELKPALSAEAAFRLLDGREGPIPPAEPFAIEVAVTNHAAAELPPGLALYGWLRRSDPSDLPCAEAAEAFLRTGRLPVGAVFLNDPLVAVVTADDTLMLVDPEFSLASANILSATPLPGRPAALVPDPEARRLLLPFPETGSLAAVDATGRLDLLGGGLGRPVAAVPAAAGGAFVLDGATGQVRRLPEGPAPGLRAEGLAPAAGAAPAAALWGPQGAALFDTASGEILIDAPGPAGAAAVLAAGGAAFGLAVLRGGELSLHFLDAPEAAVRIPLAAPATRLAVSPDGRILAAHDPAGGPVSIVDAGRSRLVQATSAEGTAIAEVLLTERAAFLMLADQTRVGVLDTRAITRGETAEFREVPLGAADAAPPAGAVFLASLAPDPGILAVHRQSRQGYRLHDYGATGNVPAMTALPLRGGEPRLVAAIDRSFRQTAPGRFRTVASLPGPGRWELVATTGLGALSFCLPVPVAEPGEAAPEPGRILALPAEDGALKLRLVAGDGAPVEAEGVLTFADLAGGWRDRVPFRTGGDGFAADLYDLPPGGAVVVTVATGDGTPFEPLILGDRR
ncbi:MAG: hypothetical protein N2Z62_10805 [Rhodobacteraceae bacterium]|nr:hypothetical protein [Paracoccaceae bacterium]